MKNKYLLFSIVFMAIAAVIAAPGVKPAVSIAAEPTARKIIVFKKDLSDSDKDKLIGRAGAERMRNLEAAKSSVALLNKRAERELAGNPDVLRIDDDVEVFALAREIKGLRAKPQPAEVLPWGVDRIDAEKIWGIAAGDSAKAAVVDTGIDLAHPDLRDNIKGGYNAINPLKSPNDDNGHGTHVAGIIGAANNSFGVVGVGPKIDLYAVKVLDRNGSGYLSDVIEGLDWVISQKNAQGGNWVVNMSLGTSSDIGSFRDAVKRVNAAGIVQVAAAGNNYGGAVDYPGAYSEVIAVSATNSSDGIANFSSVGPEVDLAAPGASIYSTYKGQAYKTLSGTSMASPHVAGTAALILSLPAGSYDLNGNGAWDPTEVKNKLKATAEDLGTAGQDNFYGAGLVDAEKAVVR